MRLTGDANKAREMMRVIRAVSKQSRGLCKPVLEKFQCETIEDVLTIYMLFIHCSSSDVICYS